jgi:hypothetical protein
LVPNHYNFRHRLRANWRTCQALVLEFDDGAPFTNEDGLIERAAKDAERAALVIRSLMGNATGAHNPNLVVFSGRKSFHCMYFLEPWIEKAAFLAAVRDFASRLRFSASTLPPGVRSTSEAALATYDDKVFATPTALCRLPSEVSEPGRLPQRCWRVIGSTPLNSMALVDAALNGLAKIEAQRPMPRAPRSTHTKSGGAYQTFDLSELALLLGGSFASDGQKLRIRCPAHDDRHPSAMVTERGFVFCSACCRPGMPWVARVTRNETTGALEVKAHD